MFIYATYACITFHICVTLFRCCLVQASQCVHVHLIQALPCAGFTIVLMSSISVQKLNTVCMSRVKSASWPNTSSQSSSLRRPLTSCSCTRMFAGGAGTDCCSIRTFTYYTNVTLYRCNLVQVSPCSGVTWCRCFLIQLSPYAGVILYRAPAPSAPHIGPHPSACQYHTECSSVTEHFRLLYKFILPGHLIQV